MEKQIKVGIGILIFKNGKVLLGKRKGSHGAGEYASPGGSMEFGESFSEAAQREIWEEAHIKVKNIQFMFLSNLRDYEGKHYIHIQLKADWKSGIPKVMEEEKCESWDWFELNNMPKPLFKTFPAVIQALKTHEVYFDR